MFKKVKSLFSRQKKLLKNSFFPAVIMKGNKIDVNSRNLTSCNVLKKVILNFIRPEPNQVLNVDSSEGLASLIINLSTIRKIALIQVVAAARRLKLQPISHFTVLMTISQDEPLLYKQTKLIQQSYSKINKL